MGVHPPQVVMRKRNGEVWWVHSPGSQMINSVDKRTIEAGKKKRIQFSSLLNHCFAVKPVMLSEAHLAVGPDKALRLHSKQQKQQERIKWNSNLRHFFLPHDPSVD